VDGKLTDILQTDMCLVVASLTVCETFVGKALRKSSLEDRESSSDRSLMGIPKIVSMLQVWY
jgi:hypothetical protein